MTIFSAKYPDKPYHDDKPESSFPMVDTEALAERISILLDELQLPIEWQRAAILLAVYRSELVRRHVEATLKTELEPLNQTVESYRITGANNADVLLELAKYPAEKRASTVFFISGLQAGGGDDGRNAYRALNLRREYFTDYNLRAILWLTESEASKLPFYAPDFWSFRQYMVEFLDTPTTSEVERELDQLEETEKEQDLAEKIIWREELLEHLLDTPETKATRAKQLLKLAQLYKDKGDKKTAQVKVESALALFEELGNQERQAYSHIVLGNIQNDLRNRDEAFALYQKAQALDPTSGLGYWGMGNVYFYRNENDQAIAMYQKGIELSPDKVGLFQALARRYRNTNRYEEAIQTYQEGIQHNPESVKLHNDLGDLYRQQKRYEEAITTYQTAIEFAPKQRTAYIGLIKIYLEQQRETDAQTIIDQFLKEDDASARFYDDLGDAYRDGQQDEKAMTAYQTTIALNPKLSWTYHSLLKLYLKQGQHEEADALVKQALTQPNLVTASFCGLLGDSYRKYKRYDKAIAAYNEAIELDPKYRYPYQSILKIYLEQERLFDARSVLSRAIKADITSASFYGNLGDLYHQHKQYEDAIIAYQKAIEIDPDYDNAYHGLATIYSVRREYQRAKTYYQKAHDLEPNVSVYLIGLAGISRHLGQLEQAEQYITTARTKSPDPYNLACLESISGNVEAALEALQQAIKEDPTDKDLARRDPDLDFIRDDPRVQALLADD
ncbi:tetratricopeptide repeat protein [Anaerolineales bacterium HSG6]|nr:tetratricopeptide repeat protein [Anaerolineales bacterium HSG6]